MPNGSLLANLAKSNSLALHAEVQHRLLQCYMDTASPVRLLQFHLVTSWPAYLRYLSEQGPCIMPTKVDF